MFPLLQPLQYAPEDERLPSYRYGLWDDLRPSEDAYLTGLCDAIYEEIQPIQRDVTARIADAVVRAALTFAAAYPDAPRAVLEPAS